MSGLKLRVTSTGLLEPIAPGAPIVITKLIPEALTQPQIRPWSVIDHSNAGPGHTDWDDLWAYMNRPDVTGESHMLADMDGVLVQLMPFTVRADCNASANRWWSDGEWRGAISFETQDNGAASLALTGWTPPQFEALAQAHAAICQAYAIPPVAPGAWYESGVGYHSAFPQWSIYVGKSCPGAARIAQMPALRQRIITLLAPDPIVIPAPRPALGENPDMKHLLVFKRNLGDGTPDPERNNTTFKLTGGTLSWIGNGYSSGIELRDVDADVISDMDVYADSLAPVPAFRGLTILHQLIDDNATIGRPPLLVRENAGLLASWRASAINDAARHG